MKSIVVGIVSFMMVVASTAMAGNFHSDCRDNHGNPHTCWRSDDDPAFAVLTVPSPVVTVKPSYQSNPENMVTVTVKCPDGMIAVAPEGFNIVPSDGNIGHVILVKMTKEVPIDADGNAIKAPIEGSEPPQFVSPSGYRALFFSRAAQPAYVRIFAGCVN